MQLMHYVIYGSASCFFLYVIILLAEGFYTISSVKELYRQIKKSACAGCISGMGLLISTRSQCQSSGCFILSQMGGHVGLFGAVLMRIVGTRFLGIIPWNAFPGRICGSALENICNTREVYTFYHLFIMAYARGGTIVIALVIYMMAITYNYVILMFNSLEDCCTKF